LRYFCSLNIFLKYCREETEERLNERENEIENLVQERRNLLEEIEKKNTLMIETTDNESQTDDHQNYKSLQENKKLKQALKKVKNQIQRIVTERPDLFDGIGEDSNERLDHLIAVVEYQAVQIDALQAERDQVEEQLRDANKELQRYFKKIILTHLIYRLSCFS
jgi:chromosome segregation ATPase